ncbi:major facilitator superfamily domain-containing protein [Cokeromyces recurvatus]|uniref:major facilitator superfamily domain-containing protein n=1 Tax=Cokeromyces recurvatus TaxID=90255 RepID=UPI00221F3518|nr:major facilitator superfamily domain-containing protein [Cokeromyces recurvatus]KAI7905835.1 major facilitator superfamily domain-containing protein [Cokeromyces recurvatus]
MSQKENRIITSTENVLGYEAIERTPSTQQVEKENEKIEKKLVRKIDLKLIPWVSILYLLLSLDRNNIGNARLGSLEKDLNLVGNDYYTALTIFFAGYVIFHIPSNLLVKILRPSHWISSTMILWGICSLCQAFTHNAAGLIACRFFLGIFETGVGPSTPLFLSFWYQRNELATRVAIYFGSATIAGAFAGAIAYGVLSTLENAHGLAGWRWLFIVEAIPTILFGLMSFVVLPDTPETTKAGRWLSAHEREIAIQRIKKSGNIDDKLFDKKQFIAAWLDYKVWFSVLIYIGLNISLASFAVFLPTLIRDMGFSLLNAQLLTIPPYVIACCLVFIVSWNSDRTLQRGYHVMSVCIIGILGYLFLLTSSSSSSSHVGLRYTGAILVACGIYPIIPLTLSWVSNNQLGHTKRGVAIAMTSMMAQCFSMLGTQIYHSEDAPRYSRGHTICLVFLVLTACSAAILRYLLARENKRRDKVYGKNEALIDMSLIDIDGVYDKHPQFRYAL